jgi:hypothetical protein
MQSITDKTGHYLHAVHVLLQIAVFGAAALALYSLHQPTIASISAATVVVVAALMVAWGL